MTSTISDTPSPVTTHIPDFGDPTYLDASLTPMVRRLPISSILKIAQDVRALTSAGRTVTNLSVGDFDSRYFPIPQRLRESIQRALAAGATNYPPPPGVPVLRQAVSDFVERACGVRYPVDSILIASGGRPLIYGVYQTVVAPGDTVVYAVPSFQNEAYIWLSGAEAVVLDGKSEHGFQPTLADLAPHLQTARLICLCSPGNPTGTAIEPATFRAILEAVVEENARRRKAGERPLFVLYDQIYGSMRVRDDKHRYAAALVPESAPYVMSMDGASKAFAATGLRVGWLMAPPAIVRRMCELLTHVGTWAPHAEQVGVAELLNDVGALHAFRQTMDDQIHARLDAVRDGFVALRNEGLPVDCITPDGAMYVSVQLRLHGMKIDGQVIESNEAIRTLLLERAGVAVVPFQAFGLQQETGWFRVSVGAVSLDDINAMFPRLRAVLREVTAPPTSAA